MKIDARARRAQGNLFKMKENNQISSAQAGALRCGGRGREVLFIPVQDDSVDSVDKGTMTLSRKHGYRNCNPLTLFELYL